ncbi:hypothetical protein Back11_17710 [Paenibacillus baekrokdamisoli]|uniref:Uncharacterized protein n=1 Tax=Paenibacillus baekrokdamisoli TaxID=1712516 RepID=A0A3G9IPX8_9BACL|nr:ankyrin repeat domain-containing protein [Paenibacillus baekrokdamisoli]MBB3073492.1 hypothetical protein [Paenibacillus baekrokdamisoli]BBH20426.1 hypothetical protein Back11_17710 [Paenibacillus baekrokdamisoli]
MKKIVGISVISIIVIILSIIIYQYIQENKNEHQRALKVDLYLKAAKSGDLERIKDLTKEVGVVEYALFEAIFNDHEQIVEYLLNSGVNPNLNYDDDIQESALGIASGKQDIKIAKLLIDAGANVNYKDKYNFTPLIRAAEEQYTSVEMLKLLVDNGADWRSKNIYNDTAYELSLRYTDSGRESDEIKIKYLEGLH